METKNSAAAKTMGNKRKSIPASGKENEPKASKVDSKGDKEKQTSGFGIDSIHFIEFFNENAEQRGYVNGFAIFTPSNCH